MSDLGVDTSVAIPLLVQRHAAHEEVVRWWEGRPLALSGHALAETYSVLTRLPGDLRVAPTDAARLLEERFGLPLTLQDPPAEAIPGRLAELGIAGGATYDALVGLAAIEHGLPLATRDARAKPTYERVGARVVIAAA